MIEHKAFLFEYEAFEDELLPLLHNALTTSDCSELIRFIQLNKDAISDPYEGRPLTEDWATMIATHDGHQYGDFALTKYYDPTDDLGIGSAWEPIQDALADGCEVPISPILGSVIGPSSAPFDPGKMGAYFQSADQVRISLTHMHKLAAKTSLKETQDAVALLEHVVQSGKGLYVTF